MVSFWKTMFELGRIKLQELGTVGVLLGAIWVLGIGMWADFTLGAYAEGMPGPGMYYALFLVAWIVLGLVIYLWQDPHGVRSGGSDGIKMTEVTESKAD